MAIAQSHDTGASCVCVSRHVPAPLELHIHHILPLADEGRRERSNEVWLCPTSHVSVHELYSSLKAGRPLPSRVNTYIKTLAEEGYTRYLAKVETP